MSIRPILEYPDPGLRQRSNTVVQFDDSLAQLVDDLIDTLCSTRAIGLSAPQIGDHRRVLVMDLSGRASPPQVFVNPEILHRQAPGLVEESCLSVPRVVGNVVRATRIRVRAQDRFGAQREIVLEDMAAVCLQHELDHLSGILFIDRLPFWRRYPLRLSAFVRARQKRSAARDRAGTAAT